MKRILLFLKLPPPVTGATLMNSFVHQSKLLREKYSIISVVFSYAKDINDLGKFRSKKLIKIIILCRKLMSRLSNEKPAFVYFQISPLSLGFLRDLIFVTIIKLFRTKIVFHLHGKGIADASKNIILKVLYKWAFKKNEIICLSKRLVADIDRVFPGRAFVLPNGIPLVDFADKAEMDESVKILFLSNLIISKGVFDYIEALQILHEKRIAFKAFIVGKEGNLSSKRLVQKIQKHKLKDVLEYLGPLYGEKKYDLLRATDILVFPTTNDVFGLVNIEAMQCGIPVISTNEGAIPEIIDDGINGFIVEKNNPQQIAKKTELLINNPELRKKMGQAGRKKYLQNYTLDIFEQRLVKIFNKVLDNGK